MTLIVETFVKRRKECWPSWVSNSRNDNPRRYRLSDRDSVGKKSKLNHLNCEYEQCFTETNIMIIISYVDMSGALRNTTLA